MNSKTVSKSLAWATAATILMAGCINMENPSPLKCDFRGTENYVVKANDIPIAFFESYSAQNGKAQFKNGIIPSLGNVGLFNGLDTDLTVVRLERSRDGNMRVTNEVAVLTETRISGDVDGVPSADDKDCVFVDVVTVSYDSLYAPPSERITPLNK